MKPPKSKPTVFAQRLAVTIACILTVGLVSISAQNDTLRHTISANTAISFIPLVIDLNTNTSIGRSNDVPYLRSHSSRPAIQLNYDFGLKQWLSLGVATSCQQFKATYDIIVSSPYNDFNTEDKTYSETVYRNNISARVLVHYKKNKSIDLYSGVRTGCTFWLTNNQSESTFIGVYEYEIAFAPQLILLGARGYFSRHFGFGTEFCLGSPHFFAAGINCRF